MDVQYTDVMKKVKQNITALIQSGRLDEAEKLLGTYLSMAPSDPEAFSMMAVLYIQKENYTQAKQFVMQGLQFDANNFDLQYNLAYLHELEQDYNQAYLIYTSLQKNSNDEYRMLLNDNIARMRSCLSLNSMNQVKLRVVFFVKQGMDSFINEIINSLSADFLTEKVIVSDLMQIDEAAKNADVCWFEWCDELIIHASRQAWAKDKKIICRLHSYEAFTEYIQHVNWSVIDRVIFVAEHIRDYVLQHTDQLQAGQSIIIPNGINLDKFTFKERKAGYNIAYVGYINYKKGPMLLLHTMKAIVDADRRYKLYIAGQFQDGRYVLYFQQMIRELGLENNVFFEGWQTDINSWLEDKNYILSTSVLEGNPLGIMEGMARGIKPLIHNFVGSEKQFKQYIWNEIKDCVRMLKTGRYDSKEYRSFIEENYSLDKQIQTIRELITDIAANTNHHLLSYYQERFMKNSDDIANTEQYFDCLLAKNDEAAYMHALQTWFVNSKHPLEFQIKYYYGNLYRKMVRYTRFQYMSTSPYEKLVSLGEKYYKELYPKKRVLFKEKSQEKKKVLFLLNGLDMNQIVTQFYVDYIKEADSTEYEYHILSVLSTNEFSGSDAAIQCLNEANINYYLPKHDNYMERIPELFSYILQLAPDVAVFQSLYFAPLNALLFPLLKRITRCTARVVHQQAEPFFDKEIDFLVSYLPEDKSISERRDIFDFPWPLKTNVVNQALDIRHKVQIPESNKIVVSMARDIYFRDNKIFWDFIVRMVTEIKDITYVVFGPSYDEHYKQFVPESLIQEQKIVFCGFDNQAAAYLKTCDYFLNTFPLGGGASLQEAYYADLPIMTYVVADNSDVDLEVTSFLLPTAWFHQAKEIFPRYGDQDELLTFAKKVITDHSYCAYIQGHRKVDSSELTYQAFSKQLEAFMNRKLG